jgi:hypothetical protein
MSFFKLLAVFAVLMLGGCKMEMTYSFQDMWQYLAKPKKTGGSIDAFKTKLEAWGAANGYVVAGAKDFPVFRKTPDGVKELAGAELALVRYFDPARPTSGILITVEKLPILDVDRMVRVYHSREGRNTEETDRQMKTVKQMRADFEAAFPELK